MHSTDDKHSDSTTTQNSEQENLKNNRVDTEHTDNNKNGAPQLTAIELRVLGVLMEKQLTTPDQYPLTLNSVITACNQKSSREPISTYNQGEVHRALQSLDNKKFIVKERSSRSEKFSQQFMHHLELGRKQQALLCVMMLRGPQTISELNTRTQRMCEFLDKGELEHCIDRLCNRDVPYAIRLGQQPGQRGERIGHLFSGTPKSQDASHGQNSVTQDARHAGGHSDSTINTGAGAADESVALLELEVATLTNNLKALEAETTELKQQLAALYKLTGHAT